MREIKPKYRYYESEPGRAGLKKQPSRKRPRRHPGRIVRMETTRLTRDNRDENAAADSADLAQEGAGWVLDQASDRIRRPHGEQPASPAHSRQKRTVKKQYAAAKRQSEARTAAHGQADARKTVKTVSEKAKQAGAFLRRHRKGAGIILAAAGLVLFLLQTVSSCTMMAQSLGAALAGSTYPSPDEEMLGAEAAYGAKEAELQSRLDRTDPAGDWDEVICEADEIRHDPYVLISLLTALHGGEWTLEEAQPTMQMLFDRQYTLEETVETQTRYRTETRTGHRTVYDPVTGQSHQEEFEYEVQVPYPWKVLKISLENFNLSHLPIYVMGERQLSAYAMYMATLGNRPDLFPRSAYPQASVPETYLDYEVPAAALADERFAAMLKEAEKYLGYPYIWGGYCPATSFDCSGYISWVLNHSGWNYGRLGVDGLLSHCKMVARGRPGDLVFFQGTLEEPGATHVGLYVGGGMMIHCGSPISYADLNTPYWQSHFYGFGRLPQ